MDKTSQIQSLEHFRACCGYSFCSLTKWHHLSFFLDYHEDSNNNLNSRLSNGFETCLFFRTKFRTTYTISRNFKSFFLVTDEKFTPVLKKMNSADKLDVYTLKHVLPIRDVNESPIGTITPVFQNVYSL